MKKEGRVVGIVQARIGSTRLPKKILMPILGKPMLQHEMERLKEARMLDTLVIATTDSTADDPVVKIAQRSGVGCFRGSERDVLGRCYGAAQGERADVVVRLTGDCPLQDPEVVDLVVGRFFEKNVDETGTPENFPEGLDTDVLSFTALETAAREAKLPSEREHVMPFVRSHPERFKLDEKWRHGGFDHSSYHWSVDTEADFRFVSEVYARLYKEGTIFHMHDVVRLLGEKPELLEINRGGTGYEWMEKGKKEDEEWLKKQSL